MNSQVTVGRIYFGWRTRFSWTGTNKVVLDRRVMEKGRKTRVCWGSSRESCDQDSLN